jgi:hypothetical protein
VAGHCARQKVGQGPVGQTGVRRDAENEAASEVSQASATPVDRRHVT